jgi:glycosyltransferase involved in cell wall biosynthesis
MLKQQVFFSIVCPTYNSAGFVEKALESLVCQTFHDYEIIISDDGSSDNTCEVCKIFLQRYAQSSYRIIENSHCGPGAARNAGLKIAKGQWIALLDSDDCWEKHKLESVVRVIEANKDVNFICHNEQFHLINGSKKQLDYHAMYDNKRPLIPQLFRRNLFSTSAVVFEKQLLTHSGYFNEQLMSAQDYEMWLRMSPDIRVYFTQDYLGHYLEREGNISSTSGLKRWWNVLKIYFMHRNKVNFLSFIVILIFHFYSLAKLVIKRVIYGHY